MGVIIAVVGSLIVGLINYLLSKKEIERRFERWELENLRRRARNLAGKSYHSNRKKEND